MDFLDLDDMKPLEGITISRGHRVICHANGSFTWEDTGEICDWNRSCKHCGELPTPEGYDPCLGEIKGAEYACCGHGIQEHGNTVFKTPVAVNP